MKRLYFIVDHLKHTESISDDIHKAGISDWHFHVLSKDESGLYRRHVHTANIYHRNDLVHSGQRGLIFGVLFGILLLLGLHFFNIELPQYIPLIFFVMASCFGAWLGGFYGIQMNNYQLKRFEAEIDKGKYLIFIDVTRKNQQQVKALMHQYHPEAKEMGQGNTLILPFA
ncbi:hypothetical protein [Catenovulum adriaticum]|uniref:Uncharacterized protein n=1 Tax=Catenovulum adriaticum TaxID=2984846 RepID=A0ABY7AJ30_9ALTE|nr:hypothetical protein [Catenovulum sp. TS8]WAJ69592.1 hypothetical protein OLW01_10525 [Catenovulum sp. TS8]